MRRQRWQSWAVFTGLAGLILGPLLGPGYILTLDLSWGRRLPPVSWADNTAPLWWALRALDVVLPGWAVEKIVLLAIFGLAGEGMRRLAALRAPGWPAYAAGILYTVNPYTYERLMAGQWLVLAGYSLLPWVVAALVRLLERPGPRRALELAVWAVALGVVSLHAAPMAALVLAATLAASGWRRGRRAAGWLVLAAGMWLAAAAVWLAPLLLHRSAPGRALADFNMAQFEAFRTNGGPLNVLALQGFWGERTGLLLPASSTGWWFGLATMLVLAAVGAGLYLGIRRRDRLALALAASALIAWVLAVGVAAAPAAGLTRWLVAHLPFYRGYREPEKWSAVLALAYAYLAALALGPLAARLRGFWRRGVPVACAMVPLMWAPLLPWGAAGQLVAVDYPASWYALNDRLSHLPAAPASRPDVLVLPWHEYLYLGFARRLVANPAPGFFDRPVIVSNDPELPGVPPPSGAAHAREVQNEVINRRFFEQNAGTRLADLGVDYVVLLKVSDWPTYDWLRSQSDLTLVAQTPDWQLFRTGTLR